jgi:hypothetical protein
VKARPGIRRPGIRDAVIPPLPLEPGIPGILPGLHPPEEGFEGKINAYLDILQDLRIDRGEFRTFFFQSGI